MILLPETDPSAHPYWYAHIIGIFHTLVHHGSLPGPIRLDLLWVHWYGLDPNCRWQLSWRGRKLPALRMTLTRNPLRLGSFILHRWYVGSISSQASTMDSPETSWNHLLHVYLTKVISILNFTTLTGNSLTILINCLFTFSSSSFVDREVVMRFRGGGVGHRNTQDATNWFMADRHPLDFATDEEDQIEDND